MTLRRAAGRLQFLGIYGLALLALSALLEAAPADNTVTTVTSHQTQPVQPILHSPWSNYPWANAPWQVRPAPNFAYNPSQGPRIDALAGSNLPDSRQSSRSTPKFLLSFDGINVAQQRLAKGGNTVLADPPQPSLCANGQYVMQTVNKAIRVYNATTGTPVTPIIDLHTFYNYPYEFNRTDNTWTTRLDLHISCLYDAQTDRWFHLAMSSDVGLPRGSPQRVDIASRLGRGLGPTVAVLRYSAYLEISVSRTGNPTGSWSIYRFPINNNGQDGSPIHDCGYNNKTGEVRPCLQDWVSSLALNDYALFTTIKESAGVSGIRDPTKGDSFIYAIPKAPLVEGRPATAYDFQVADLAKISNGTVGPFKYEALQPAKTPQPYLSHPAHKRSQYFVATKRLRECYEVGNTAYNCTGSQDVYLFELKNTDNLPSSTLSVQTLQLRNKYSMPVAAEQDKPGANWPLGQCFNNITCRLQELSDSATDDTSKTLSIPPVLTGGPDCVSVSLAYDLLWVVFPTDVTYVGVDNRINHFTGTFWVVIDPINKKIKKEGIVGLRNSHLIAPSIAIVPPQPWQRAGCKPRGIISFTIIGPDYWPTAAYVNLDGLQGPDSRVNIVGLGKAPLESSVLRGVDPPSRRAPQGYMLGIGNTGMQQFSYDNGAGAMAVYKDIVWFASEYVGYDCSLQEFAGVRDPDYNPTFSASRCGFNRATYANWATRVAKISAFGA